MGNAQATTQTMLDACGTAWIIERPGDTGAEWNRLKDECVNKAVLPYRGTTFAPIPPIEGVPPFLLDEIHETQRNA